MPAPKWSQITSSPEWNQVTPDQQEHIRLGWMKSVLDENPEWGADKIKELNAITRQHQPEGQPQQQAPDQQPVAQPDVTADGQLDLSATPFPKQEDPVMQTAGPADGSIAPSETPAPPAPIEEPQPTYPEYSAQQAVKDTGTAFKDQWEMTPFASVMRGYRDDGVGGAIGRALGYPMRMAVGLVKEIGLTDAAMKVIGTLNAAQAGAVEGMTQKRLEISDTNWHEQPPEDRLRDIKETINNEGFRHSFGDQVPIPLGFSLPDKLRDIIINQSLSGRKPGEIDKILVAMMGTGELKDIPKVVPRHSDKKDDEGEPIYPLDNPFAGMGRGFMDLFSLKGVRKGVTESIRGKVVTISDMRKALKGNTYEERLGVANGIAISILGDMMTDPFIVANLPKQVLQGIVNKISKGQTKKAFQMLSRILEGEKYVDEVKRIKLLKRFREKGFNKKVNLLKDSLADAKKRGGKGTLITPGRSIPGQGAGTKALKEADLTGKGTRKAITAGRSTKGRPSNAISNPSPSKQAIPLGESTGSGKVERVGKGIPVGEASEEAIRKASQATTKGRLSKPSLKKGQEGIPLSPQPSRKALPPGGEGGTPVHKGKIALGPGKQQITVKLRKSPANIQKNAGKRFKVDGIMKLDGDMRAAGYTEDMVQVTHPASKGSRVIPMSRATKRGFKTLDEAMRKEFGLVKKKKKGFTIKPIGKGTKGTPETLGHGKVIGKQAQFKKVADGVEHAEFRGLTEEGTKYEMVSIHNKKNGSTTQVLSSKFSKEWLEKYIKESVENGLKNWNTNTRQFKGLTKDIQAVDLVNNGDVVVKNLHTGATKTFKYEDIIDQAGGHKILKDWVDEGKKIDQPNVVQGKFPQVQERDIGGGQKIRVDHEGMPIRKPGEKGLEDIPFDMEGDLLAMDPQTGQIVQTPRGKKLAADRALKRLREMDTKMKDKGYTYRIDLPEGKGEPLYTKDFNAGVEMAKEYGKGTKVVNLQDVKLQSVQGGIIKPRPPKKVTEPDIITKEQFEEIKKKNSDDGEILGSLLGGIQTFLENKAAKGITEQGLKRWKFAPFSVIKPWEDISPRVGAAIKNLFSHAEGVHTKGVDKMKELSKIGQTGRHNLGAEKFTMVDGKKISLKYTDDDLSELALLANNKERWDALSKADKVKYKAGVKHVREFFDWARGEYRKLGADIDFKKRMTDIYEEQIASLGKITDDLRKEPLQGYDRNILKDLGFDVKGLPKELSRKQTATFVRENLENNAEVLEKLKKMEFVHIPYDMWFQSGKITRGATLKALRIANAQKRKTILIEDLIEAGAIKKSDVNIFDIMSSYVHRMSKDIAMLNLKKIAKAEGLVSAEKKAGFKKLPVFQAPMFHDVHMHPALMDWMMDFKFQKFNATAVDKVFSSVKMWQFAKPLFLPYYDLAQAAAARAFSNPLHLMRDARDAFKMMRDHGDEWQAAMQYGVPSRPIDVPWDQFTDTLNKLKGTTLGDWATAQIDNKNWTVIKPVYNALWETAWTGDKFIRLTTYNYFRKTLKMGKAEASQLTALFHSDYANVPIETRRKLNKIFFTPTFKVTMFRLYKEMGKAMVKVPVKAAMGKTLTSQEKQLAKGGVATTVGMMYGFDWLMQNALGYKRDQFARRYYKQVEDPDNPRMMRDHVVVFSNPMTMIPKYLQKGSKIWGGLDSDDKLTTVIDTMKWEIHPIYRIAYDVARNKKANGESIVIPFDDAPGMGPMKKLAYAMKESIKVLEAIPAMKEEESVEAYKQWEKEAGFLFSTLNAPATFSYYRSPKVRKQGFLIDERKREMRSTMRRLLRDKKLTPQRKARMLKNFQEQMEKDIAEYDRLLAEYDKGVIGQWKRDSINSKKIKAAKEKKRKESIKPPTPFISVPDHTPGPGA